MGLGWNQIEADAPGLAFDASSGGLSSGNRPVKESHSQENSVPKPGLIQDKA